MRYGPSRHFAAVAKKEKAATSKVGWRRQYREESLPPPLHQEKETFVEMAVANGTSYCEWLFDDFPSKKKSFASSPTFIRPSPCVLEANQRYQLWSSGAWQRMCERRKEIVICIWVVFRRKGAGKRAMVERLLIIPFLSSFYKSPWETCFSRGAEFGASRLLLLKWSLRQFWAGEMATLLGDGRPARPRRSARFKIIPAQCTSSAKDGKVLSISKHQQKQSQLFF